MDGVVLAADGRKVAPREVYGDALVELGERRPDVVVLDADVANSTFTERFGRRFPERFFNLGLCEAHMIGVAAGLARCGKIPYASTFAIFAAQRALNQIFQSVAYAQLPVRIVVTHAGITVGEDGATHQTVDDIAILRAMPGMTVIVPSDATQTREVVFGVCDHPGPVYVRLGRPAIPVLYERCPFRVGQAYVLQEGTDVTLVGCGIGTWLCLEAARILLEKGISAEVIDSPTIKPLDRTTIVTSARRTGAVVTVEEHSILGGLGGAVAELLAEEYPVPVRRVGVQDQFGQSGKWDELLAHYGLVPERVAGEAEALLAGRAQEVAQWTSW
jgi:transketolase